MKKDNEDDLSLREKIEKATLLIDQLVLNHPEIQAFTWFSACLSCAVSTAIYNKVPYTDFRKEMDDFFEHTKKMFEEENLI